MRLLLMCCFLFGAFSSIAAGPWFQKSDFPADARHRTTAFSIGNSGYIGLGHINSGIDVEYKDFWKYDPASNSWSQIADYPEGKMYHAACFVIGNLAYVGTGRKEDGSYSTKFHAYNPQTNSWSPIADFIGESRRGAVGFALNGDGFIGTGQVNTGFTSTFYKYEVVNDIWSQVTSIPAVERTSSVGFELNNKGYVGTGETNLGSINDFWEYDPILNSWTQKASVGSINRQEAFGFSLNGSGYIGTGVDISGGNNFKDFMKYNPSTDSWTLLEEFAGTARRYLSGFTMGSRAYMGTGTNGTNFNDFWMYDPALTGLDELLNDIQVKIFPNPASKVLKVDVGDVSNEIEKGTLRFIVSDIQGKQLINLPIEELEFSVDISHLPSSMYTYTFEYERLVIKSGKLIRRR